MALNASLQQFVNKGAGVYQLTYDKSQVVSQVSNNTRLVIGFSKQGPFNVPVFCPDTDYFTSIFGDIDRSLERKGSFFHRSCITSLTEGPILALNLLNLNSDLTDINADKIDYQALSTSSTSSNDSKRQLLYELFYNRDKFWFPDPDEFLNNIGSNKELIQFTNIGKKPISILAKRSSLKGFDVTFKEWFGSGNVPSYANGFDYIADYFIDVYVVEGNFTNYAQLSIDPIFGRYFDSTGIKTGSLETFLQDPNVTTIGLYQGTLIPDFIDKQGANYFIETLINQDSNRTGLLCAIDKAKFDDEYLSGTIVDLVGHGLEKADTTSVNFLSYTGSINSDFAYTQKATNTIVTFTTAAGLTLESSSNSLYPGRKNVLHITSANSDFDAFDDNAVTNQTYIQGIVTTAGVSATGLSAGDTLWLRVSAITKTATDIFITVNDLGYASTSFVEINNAIAGSGDYGVVWNPNYIKRDTAASPIDFKAAEFSQLYIDWSSGKITDGDLIVEDAVSPINHYLKFIPGVDVEGFKYIAVKSYTTDSLTVASAQPIFDDTRNSAGAVVTGSKINIISYIGNLNQSLPAAATSQANIINIDNTSGLYTLAVKVGDYLVNDYGSSTTDSRLTKVTKITNIAGNIIQVTCNESIAIQSGTVRKYVSIDQFLTHYNFISLAGFTLKESHQPNNTNTRMNEILSVLTNTNLFTSLANREFRFRYIIDTFNHGIEASSKAIYGRLAKSRSDVFCIVNAPSVKEFGASTDPQFKDAPSTTNPVPKLNTTYIPTGGNLTLNPETIYSLPSVTDGAAYMAFYTPNLLIADRGKNISVPPAAAIGNLFVRKHKENLPWSIIAWNKRGVISASGLVGLEYQYDDSDRDQLENFGLNTIIQKAGVGPMITSNSTAQQTIKTSLSQIHATEVLIELQQAIRAILLNYVWEFNTPQTRLEIKSLCDQALDRFVSDNAIYDYQNVMNSTNNTSDVIDANMGVIDTFIEIVRGLGKIVHRSTLLKTGAIRTGDFTIQ